MIASGRPLPYDEAVYATRVRDLATDVPATRFADVYRPPGLPLLGVVGALTGWSDEPLRAVTLLLAVVALAAVWVFARVLFERPTALLAECALISRPGPAIPMVP